MLVLLVILLLLLSLLGTGWLLMVMADPPIGRTAENHIQASVSATKLLRQLKESLGCAISFFRMHPRKSSSKHPY